MVTSAAGLVSGGGGVSEGIAGAGGERRGAHHYGVELEEGEEEKAERLVRQELARQKWSEEYLAGRPKTDLKKAQVARLLRRETTMTLAWIARRLQMGSVNTLKNTLRLANSRD